MKIKIFHFFLNILPTSYICDFKATNIVRKSLNTPLSVSDCVSLYLFTVRLPALVAALTDYSGEEEYASLLQSTFVQPYDTCTRTHGECHTSIEVEAVSFEIVSICYELFLAKFHVVSWFACLVRIRVIA